MTKSLRSTTVLAVVFVVLAGPVGAHAQVYADGALGSLYVSAEPTGYNGVIWNPPSFTPFQFYLVADIDFADIGRPEQNGTNGLLAWDGRVTVPPALFVIETVIEPSTSIDIGTKAPPFFDYIVGTGQRVPVGQPYSLVTFRAFLMVPVEVDLFVRTLPPALASAPNAASWVEFAAMNGCEASPGHPTPCLFPFARLRDLRLASGHSDPGQQRIDTDTISVVCRGSTTTVEIGILTVSSLEYDANRLGVPDIEARSAQDFTAFGLEVGVPAGFQLTGWRPGGLTETWTELDCVQTSETTVRVDASDPGGFDWAAEDRYLARLTFDVPCETPGTSLETCITQVFYGLSFHGLGCGTATFVEVGDVDANRVVGTGDAQCAFNGWLVNARPACATLGGWPASADVDCNRIVTPRDALCIFRSWLDGSCTFCTPGADTLARPSAPALTHALVDRGDGWEFTVRTTAPLALQAWGLDFEGLSSLGEPETVEFVHEDLANEVVASGWNADADRLRVGAVTREPITIDGVVLRAVWSKGSPVDSDAIRLVGSSDDLAGATSMAFATTPPPVALERAVIEVSPSPFNPRTTIRVYVPATANGVEPRLGVHDARGRLVRRLPVAIVPGAWTSVVWDGRDDTGKEVASGNFFVRMDGLSEPVVAKITLVR